MFHNKKLDAKAAHPAQSLDLSLCLYFYIDIFTKQQNQLSFEADLTEQEQAFEDIVGLRRTACHTLGTIIDALKRTKDHPTFINNPSTFEQKEQACRFDYYWENIKRSLIKASARIDNYITKQTQHKNMQDALVDLIRPTAPTEIKQALSVITKILTAVRDIDFSTIHIIPQDYIEPRQYKNTWESIKGIPTTTAMPAHLYVFREFLTVYEHHVIIFYEKVEHYIQQAEARNQARRELASLELKENMIQKRNLLNKQSNDYSEKLHQLGLQIEKEHSQSQFKSWYKIIELLKQIHHEYTLCISHLEKETKEPSDRETNLTSQRKEFLLSLSKPEDTIAYIEKYFLTLANEIKLNTVTPDNVFNVVTISPSKTKHVLLADNIQIKYPEFISPSNLLVSLKKMNQYLPTEFPSRSAPAPLIKACTLPLKSINALLTSGLTTPEEKTTIEKYIELANKHKYHLLGEGKKVKFMQNIPLVHAIYHKYKDALSELMKTTAVSKSEFK